KPSIASRGTNGDHVDVASNNGRPDQSGGCYCQHATPGTDIERAAHAPSLRQVGECEQASAGCSMVAGAKRERRFDFDADIIGPQPRPIVGPMTDETARAHRL